MHLSLYLRGVKAKIRLTLNSIIDLCTTRLISSYNEIDQRFHKLSIFMQAWRTSYLRQEAEGQISGKEPANSEMSAYRSEIDLRESSFSSEHLVSLYALQLMLITFMQSRG